MFKEATETENRLVYDLLNRYDSYLQEKKYTWWSVLRKWMNENIDLETCKKFNNKYFSGGRVFFTVQAYLPIVCINGNLYMVQTDENSNITDFEMTTLLTASIRKNGWPGKGELLLLSRTPEVPAIITNTDGLRNALEVGYRWHESIRNILLEASAETLERWALESAFFNIVHAQYKRGESIDYSSDSDYRQWV